MFSRFWGEVFAQLDPVPMGPSRLARRKHGKRMYARGQNDLSPRHYREAERQAEGQAELDKTDDPDVDYIMTNCQNTSWLRARARARAEKRKPPTVREFLGVELHDRMWDQRYG